MAITVGSAAPDFTLKDQTQKEVKLSEFQGKKNVVIVFYPLDWSPTCTNEHMCLVNDMKRFEELDAQVLGAVSYTHLDVYKRQSKFSVTNGVDKNGERELATWNRR